MPPAASCCRDRRQCLGHASAILARGIRRVRQSSTFNLYQATVNVSYAPDVFGGLRRQIEATPAAGGIAALRAGSDLSDADRERGDGRDPGSLAARPDRSDRTNHQGGERSARRRAQSVRGRRRQPRRRADAGIAGCDHEATLPPLQKLLEQQHHLLLALIGRFPSEGHGKDLRLAALHLPTQLPVSVPTQLVEQRPDIRAAQAQLHQVSAQIGVAIANRLPQFALTADYGSAALTTAALFTPATGDLEHRGERHPADLPRLQLAASAACRRSGVHHGRRTIPQHGAAGVPERRRRAAGGAIGRGDAEGAAARRQGGVRHVRSDARPIPARRRHLPHPAQRAAQLSAGAAGFGASPGRPLCRHRRLVPGAGRRLVEPHRRRARYAQPRGDQARPRGERRRRPRRNGAQ